MKNFKIATAALVAIMFASCAKTPGGEPVNNEPSSVAIGISLPGSKNSRAIGTPVANDAVADLAIGHVFIYSSVTNLIDKHVVLYTGDAPSGYGSAITETFANITNPDDKDRVIISNVRAEADRCLVILNGYNAVGTDLITGDKTGSSITSIKALSLVAPAINDANSTINKVALYDDKALSLTGGTTGGESGTQEYDRTATMAAAALGTRIQLKEISSHGYTGGDGTVTAITGYTVAGVYINYVYNARTLGAEASGALQVDNGSTEANYFGASSKYASGQPGYMLADNSANITAVDGKVAPESGWWGYNLIPYPASANPGVPHLIIHLTDIDYTVGGVAQTQITDKWLTVRGYKETVEGVPTDVTNFLANHIYSLADGLSFDFNDLTDNPETENVALSVYIEVIPWTNHNVTPVL